SRLFYDTKMRTSLRNLFAQIKLFSTFTKFFSAMPINRNLMIRVTTIDRCLQNHYRQWTLDDLIAACSDALYEFEGRRDGVSRRTIQSDIQLMRSEKLGYNAPIVVKERKFYTYDDPGYSITRIPLSETDVNSLSQAMDILKHFQIFSQFSPVSDIINRLEDHIAVTTAHTIPVIHLEKNDRLKGLEFVSELYESIVKKRCVDIGYQSFKAKEGSLNTVSPYLLKEFKNRWFLLGHQHSAKEIRTFALDRIVSISRNTETDFVPNTFFDPEHYFDNVIGVTKGLGKPEAHVKLRIDADQAPYIRTKPLHSTQQILEEREDGSIVVSIQVVVNLELEREILSYCEHIEVLEPRLLRHRVRRKLQAAAGIYL
ncbi:MAG: WYL domain-containing protein, partial [Paludibacteraceae bacterium]